jgi:hypothetical protein
VPALNPLIPYVIKMLIKTCKSVLIASFLLSVFAPLTDANCTIPVILRGKWFSRENNVNTHIEINDNRMTDRGECVDIRDNFHVNYTMLFRKHMCYTCVKIIVRTVNVLEKIESESQTYKMSLINVTF